MTLSPSFKSDLKAYCLYLFFALIITVLAVLNGCCCNDKHETNRRVFAVENRTPEQQEEAEKANRELMYYQNKNECSCKSKDHGLRDCIDTAIAKEMKCEDNNKSRAGRRYCEDMLLVDIYSCRGKQ